MHPARKKRLSIIIFSVLVFGLALSVILYALQQNIDLYFTPEQVDVKKHTTLTQFRLGGMVKQHSVKKDKDLNVSFIVTDFKRDIPVHYHGILPALFKEGQGVVLEGSLTSSGEFEAHRVLAKHDEKYMPPQIKPQTKVTENVR
jgi:cytochrome c-type biogenesis protein CcmE